MSRKKAYWLCQILGWTVYQLVGLAFIAAFMKVETRDVIAHVGTIFTAMGASHLHRAIIRRTGLMQLDWLKRVPLLLFTTAFAGLVAAGGALTVGFGLAGYTSLGPKTAPFFASWIVAMLFWTVLYVAVHDVENYKRAERKNLELQVAAKEAELRSLHAQINPHFLFNWLN